MTEDEKIIAFAVTALEECDTIELSDNEIDRLIALARNGAAVQPAVADIASERERQKTVEGWTLDHDDKYSSGELAMAAALYATPDPDLKRIELHDNGVSFVDPWPWWNEHDTGRSFSRERAWWKPQARRRDLVRAAALIVAEIERLDRAAQVTP